MSEAFIINAAQGSVNALSGRPYAEQVLPILQDVLEKSGIPARRIQEMHWLSGPEEYWFTALAQRLEFAPELVRFQWPVVPALAHTILQSMSRAIETGERDLVLIAQQSGDQVIALMLASPTAVGQHNLAPRARVALRLALGRLPDGLWATTRASLEKAELDPEQVHRLASSGRSNPAEWKSTFPSLQPLTGDRLPSADLFLLDALVRNLEESSGSIGLLLSQAPHGSTLATFVERT